MVFIVFVVEVRFVGTNTCKISIPYYGPEAGGFWV